jgi:hypothetical protein
MDPSLIEIIRSAVDQARMLGLGAEEQCSAAEAVLLSLTPSLSPTTAQLIVEQLFPFVAEMHFAVA